MKRSPLFWPSLALLIGIAGYTGASVIPAIIPQAVPTANKRGNGTVFALASSNTAGTAGQVACDDGSGNLTYSGCTLNSVSSTSPVTVNTNTTMDQQLMELSLSAGYLNSAGRNFDFFGAGVYTTQTAQTPTLTFKIKLCTVSGCGSGTVVTLISITTGATTAASANISWNVRAVGVTATAGATGNLEIHGPAQVDLGSALSTAATVYNDTNTAVSSNIDLTAALFADFTVAFSTNAATANTCTQRESVISPGGSTSGGGGGGGILSKVGTFSTRPASGTNSGDLFSATDSPISSIWNGSSWVNFAFHSPVTLPTASTFGTAVNVTSSTLSATTGPLIMTQADTTGQVHAWVTSVFTNTGVFLFNMKPSALGAFQAGVLFRESATGKLLVFTFANNGINVDRWTNPTTFSSNVFRNTSPVIFTPFVALRLRIVGANLFFDYSWDAGQNWLQLYTEAKTAFFTTGPDQDGIGGTTSGDVVDYYNYSTT